MITALLTLLIAILTVPVAWAIYRILAGRLSAPAARALYDHFWLYLAIAMLSGSALGHLYGFLLRRILQISE